MWKRKRITAKTPWPVKTGYGEKNRQRNGMNLGFELDSIISLFRLLNLNLTFMNSCTWTAQDNKMRSLDPIQSQLKQVENFHVFWSALLSLNWTKFGPKWHRNIKLQFLRLNSKTSVVSEEIIYIHWKGPVCSFVFVCLFSSLVV